MCKVSQVIGRLAGILADEGDAPICVVLWQVSDVLDRAKERGLVITPEQAARVLHRARERHDATQGISWATIDGYTGSILEEDARPDENTDAVSVGACLEVLNRAQGLMRAAQIPLLCSARADAQASSADIDAFCKKYDPLMPEKWGH